MRPVAQLPGDAEPLRVLATTVPNRGWTPVTVPGAVDAWGKMSERFGKLSMERLLAPAVNVLKVVSLAGCAVSLGSRCY